MDQPAWFLLCRYWIAYFQTGFYHRQPPPAVTLPISAPNARDMGGFGNKPAGRWVDFHPSPCSNIEPGALPEISDLGLG